MRKIRLKTEIDPSLKETEVIIRAPEEDDETAALASQILSGFPKTLTIQGADGVLLNIPMKDIVSISVDRKQVCIATEEEKYIVRQSLNSLEEKLVSGRFVRISRFEIVNLDKVRKYDFTMGGTLRLELAGGIETWASRRNIPMIRGKLKKEE